MKELLFKNSSPHTIHLDLDTQGKPIFLAHLIQNIILLTPALLPHFEFPKNFLFHINLVLKNQG